MRHTARSFARNARCLLVGDVVYLPQTSLSWRDLNRLGRHLGTVPWFLKLTKDRQMENVTGSRPVFLILILKELYNDYRMNHDRREPRWIRRLPKPVIAELRRGFMAGPGSEPLAIVFDIPYTGIGYLVREGGLTEMAARHLGMFRLNGIRQLGLLHDPIVHALDVSGYATPFGHTRYCHSLDVQAIALLMAINNCLSRRDRNMLRIASNLHDVLTPAGGDSIKLIDPERFDEDANFAAIFNRAGWPKFKHRFPTAEQRLLETIQGQGPLGTLLDLADKFAYVARDANAFLGRDIPNGSEEYRAVAKIVARRPRVCSIWDDVTIRDGQVVIDDPNRLFDFLKLRALLFRGLYYNPSARFLEHTLGQVVAQRLYENGQLTQDQLLAENDDWLERRIGEAIGQSFFGFGAVSNIRPRVETFLTLEAAHAREAFLKQSSPRLVTLIETFRGGTRPGTHYLVKTSRGRVLPFAEAFPRRAETIAALFRYERPIRLYHFEGPALGEATL